MREQKGRNMMESKEEETVRKRKMGDMEYDVNGDRGEANEEIEEEEDGIDFSGSQEMKLGIARIFDKIDRFNQLVSEILESGKSVFSKLSQEFEERVLMIHKEQMEKWQEEIKELRMIDATNEEMNARLENVKCLLQTVHISQ